MKGLLRRLLLDRIVSDKMSERMNLIYGRTHLIKRLGKVTRDEYVAVLQTVADTFSNITSSTTKVEIELYGSWPTWTTTLGLPEEMEGQQQYNAEKVTATITNIADLTEEAFKAAVFVQARINPRSYAAKTKYACGWVSTGANAPHAVNVQAQPIEMFSAALWPKIAKLFGAKFAFHYSFIHDGTMSLT